MTPPGQAFCRRKHLHHRPGGKPIFVDQMEDA
jgi:hypothetical protein